MYICKVCYVNRAKSGVYIFAFGQKLCPLSIRGLECLCKPLQKSGGDIWGPRMEKFSHFSSRSPPNGRFPEGCQLLLQVNQLYTVTFLANRV